MNAVEVNNLGRDFGGVKAVQNLSFNVEAGEIFGLVGPDGAGKTTTLRMLCGLMAPTSGSARVLGIDVAANPESVKPEIGYMSQRFGLYDDLTVAENISFYAEIYRVPKAMYRERAERLLKFSGLAPFADRLFRNLSGGMKQKVGLTCALIHTPKVLFLDEPTNGVDPVSRRDFWKILYELKKEGVTILVATTYLDEADRCHRIALLENGAARVLMEPGQMRLMIPGSLFSLKATDRRRALTMLRAMPMVRTPNIYGPRLHFFLSDEADLGQVTAMLAEGGIETLEMEKITPGLEDVYLSLLEAPASGKAA